PAGERWIARPLRALAREEVPAARGRLREGPALEARRRARLASDRRGALRRGGGARPRARARRTPGHARGGGTPGGVLRRRVNGRRARARARLPRDTRRGGARPGTRRPRGRARPDHDPLARAPARARDGWSLWRHAGAARAALSSVGVPSRLARASRPGRG